MKETMKKLLAFMTVVIIAVGLLPVASIEAKAAGSVELTTVMDCSVWSAPNTSEEYRVKKIPAGYKVTVYTQVVNSTAGDGKTFYMTVKGSYILCKCFGSTPSAPVSSYVPSDKKYGYANNLPGRTLIVTFYENDKYLKWTDTSEYYDLIKCLDVAVPYIEKQCANYGVKTEFLYDWTVYPDLVYTSSVNVDVRNDSRAYSKLKDSITSKCNLDALMEKYDAQNVVCIAIFDSDSTNTKHNATYMCTPDYYIDVEIVRLFTEVNYGSGVGKLLPSSIAHEILHAFGAPDLYSASKTIPQKYVNYLVNNKVSDIMRTTNYGNSVNSPITDVSAYYLGLAPTCKDLYTFGLGLTEKAY